VCEERPLEKITVALGNVGRHTDSNLSWAT
jgi:hypothetical protein